MTDNFLQLLKYLKIALDDEQTQSNFTIREKSGTPGTGKSSSGVFDFEYGRQQMLSDLMYDHWYLELKAKDESLMSDCEFVSDLKDMRIAWESYSRGEGLACGYSSTPISVNGVFAYEYTIEHATGKKSVPPYTFILVDEGSAIFPLLNFSDRENAFLTQNRYLRHEKKRLVVLEQERDGINKDLRRVIAMNEEMVERAELFKPELLNLIINKLKFYGLRKNVQSSKYLHFLDKLIFLESKIGIVRWRSVITSTDSSLITPEQIEREFYALRDNSIHYNDKALRYVSGQINNPITDMKVWNSHIIQPNSEESEMYKKGLNMFKEVDEEKTYKKKKYYPF